MSRNSSTMRYALFVCLGIAGGCGQPGSDSQHTEFEITSYAELPMLQTTHDPQLKAEFARLQSEEATPIQLANRPANRSEADASPTAATQLTEIYDERLRERLERAIESTYPLGPFQLSNTQLEDAATILEEQQDARQRFRTLMGNRHSIFQIDHRLGIAADLSFVDAARVGNRVEALQAAMWLEHNDLPAAIRVLDSLFDTVRQLASVPHLVPRLEAVRLRGETLRVVEAIVQHDQVAGEDLAALQTRMQQQLDEWVGSQAAWIAERAEAMHVYELIRDGHLLSVLDLEEFLWDEKQLEVFALQVMQNLDGDELLYLRWMRRLIADCDQPYYSRQGTWREIRRQLELLEGRPGYPTVAGRILMADYPRAERLLGLDRARIEAWNLALTLALGEKQTITRNPLTGYPYILDQNETRVIVDALNPGEAEPTIRVPVFGPDRE